MARDARTPFQRTNDASLVEAMGTGDFARMATLLNERARGLGTPLKFVTAANGVDVKNNNGIFSRTVGHITFEQDGASGWYHLARLQSGKTVLDIPEFLKGRSDRVMIGSIIADRGIEHSSGSAVADMQGAISEIAELYACPENLSHGAPAPPT